ncbi:unnamed protein product, partial [Porites lobata]
AGQCQEAKIVIQSPDTDVLVLSAAHFEDIASKELWFRTGVKDRLRFVPVLDVCQNLSRLLMSIDTSSFVKRSLTVRLYHQPLTACDNTSTVQTTRRTFGEKASMPYSSSHLP